MASSIEDIDCADDKITSDDVKKWYFESEKLIRIIANLTSDQSAHQAVNQLRYAGHHLLKNGASDVVEAYKHCKRAYYDALDLYVLTMAGYFKSNVIYIENDDQKSHLRATLKAHLKSIQNARFNTQTRIEYYQFIRESLVEGLRLIDEINQALKMPAGAKHFTEAQQAMFSENTELRAHNQKLNQQVKGLNQKINSKMAKISLALALVIALSTAIGLLFQGALTDYFRAPVVNVEHSLHSTQFPFIPLGKK